MTARDDVEPFALAAVHAEVMQVGADLDLERVLQAVTDTGTRLSGAQVGAFFYNAVDATGRMYRLHVVSGVSADVFRDLPEPRITELFEPTFSGDRTVRVADLDTGAYRGRLPRGHLPVRSYLATPVVGSDGEVIGALLFGHPDPGAFDERSEDLVVVVAAQAAIAIENARLFEQEQTARQQAERAAERLAVLNEVTARLATSVGVTDALDAVADTVAGAYRATRMAVFLRGDETVHGVTSTRLPGIPAGESAPSDTVLQLPMVTRDEEIGALVLAWDDAPALAPADHELLVSAAGQLTSAVERARLYDAEATARRRLRRHVAELTEASLTLQRSLLPDTLPVVAGISTAVRYLPAAADAEVGGDWYDVVPSLNGTLTLAIGDVQGHNMQAAAEMGRLRTTLRAYLAEGHSAAEALARTNQLTANQHEAMLATCCLLTIDPATGQLGLVRAGHPLPVLRRADGTLCELAEGAGPPLGVDVDQRWDQELVQLRCGDRLVLYTDGLVDARGPGSVDRVEVLLAAVEAVADLPAEAAADELLRRMRNHNEDDVALLVCDYSHPQHLAERLSPDF